jgi:hypothetical protein
VSLALALVGSLIGDPQAGVTVAVDSSRKEVVIEAGPFDVPSAHHAGGHGEHHPKLLGFRWPVDGWARGFALEIHGPGGRPLERKLLHHLNLVNFERRQLVHPAFERLVALGSETDDVSLPGGVGVPIERSSRMALLVAWGNDGHESLSGVSVRLRIKWLPPRTSPAPTPVLIWMADADFTAGTTDAYDLPAGPSERTFEFALPESGRLLAVGGHLHDYGTLLRLEEAETGRTVLDLVPRVDAAGRLLGMPRALPGVTGDGIKLHAGRCYRLVARYDNRAGRPLENGAMAVMAGIFAPDRLERWSIAAGGADLAADAAGLLRLDGRGLEFEGAGWQSAETALKPTTASSAPVRSRT